MFNIYFILFESVPASNWHENGQRLRLTKTFFNEVFLNHEVIQHYPKIDV